MQKKSKKFLIEENEVKTFPVTVSKKQLRDRYNVSYKKLRDMFTDEKRLEISYDSRRIFTPHETSLIFQYLEPERYRLFLEKSA